MANEKRLICAYVLAEKVHESKHQNPHDDPKVARNHMLEHDHFLKMIRLSPTEDAVEVVHGRWMYDSGSGKYFCSACDEDALSFKKDTLYGGDLYEVCLTDYCPNCGAKMDGGNEDGV